MRKYLCDVKPYETFTINNFAGLYILDTNSVSEPDTIFVAQINDGRVSRLNPKTKVTVVDVVDTEPKPEPKTHLSDLQNGQVFRINDSGFDEQFTKIGLRKDIKVTAIDNECNNKESNAKYIYIANDSHIMYCSSVNYSVEIVE